jgi:ABC-type transport system substrate-binding protein
VLKTSKLNQYDVLVRNDRYWGDKPAIRQVTVKVIPDPMTRAVAFETGDIDLLYGNEGCCRWIPSPVSAITRPGVPSSLSLSKR